jgi:hypothetical protein
MNVVVLIQDNIIKEFKQESGTTDLGHIFANFYLQMPFLYFVLLYGFTCCLIFLIVKGHFYS